MSRSPSILDSPIAYLKGVGPARADLLQKELGVFTFRELLDHFPFRYIDRTVVNDIGTIKPGPEFVQVRGTISEPSIVGVRAGRRLTATIRDATGSLELVWFQGISWVQKSLQPGHAYLASGRVSWFNGKPQLTHPELEPLTAEAMRGGKGLEAVYPTTEKLKARGLGSRQLGKLIQSMLTQVTGKDIPENLPAGLLQQLALPGRYEAFRSIHQPRNNAYAGSALNRLKFEELFVSQVRHQLVRNRRHRYSKGVVFAEVGTLFNEFYSKCLPFELTGAQKKVLREIRQDTGRGYQMNRLLQGDVGSGKTVVALLAMLLAADNGFQSCLMAPTEILARQHFESLSLLLKDLPVRLDLLTGSTKSAERKGLLKALEAGETHIIVGTHALIEEAVRFSRLGLAVVDEQHRFGVAQRARLWEKAELQPHILVMTATPIPRTLAMTAYGDLDTSVMDELPPGRKPVTTVHRTEFSRAKVMDFIRTEVAKGRQAYIIYPLIEESEKLSYEDLMQGYEQVKSFFPEPAYRISMVHGRQPAAQKETNMQRFVSGDTQIMVSTTVIEVGVNVPNASVMVIESAEKFGLSQLHQLRGRVGRGAEQSYCILLTASRVGAEAKERMNILCSTNDGFRIAQKDLELRGPGLIEGTKQSGAAEFRLASIVDDADLLELAKKWAGQLIEADEHLSSAANLPLKAFLEDRPGKTAWSRIS